jgi:hypothetical protein
MAKGWIAIQFVPSAILVVALPAVGAYISYKFNESAIVNEAATYLQDAQAALDAKDASLAVYYAGAATALSQSAFVQTSAADIAIKAGNLNLAKSLLVRAIAVAMPEDQAFIRRTQEHLELPFY